MIDPEASIGEGFDPVDVFNKVRSSPRPILSDASRQLLRSSPEDWAVARKRMLKTSLLNADDELFELVINEYAAILGINGAIDTVLRIWGNMVSEDMDEE